MRGAIVLMEDAPAGSRTERAVAEQSGVPDFEAFERNAHERARRAEERERAATARAERARAEAASAAVDTVRREREREAQAHERAAAAQRLAIDLQLEHAAHARSFVERSAADRGV